MRVQTRHCGGLCAIYPQAFAGIVTVSVGHCHPEVNAAIHAQNQLLQHTTTIYLNHQIAEYAKELADRMPGNLKVRACKQGSRCRRMGAGLSLKVSRGASTAA